MNQPQKNNLVELLKLKKIQFKVLCALLTLSACGSRESSSSIATSETQGSQGPQGEMGRQGPAGANGQPGESFQQATRKLIDKLKPIRSGVVNLLCGDASGTGTRISEDTVVTAFHVLECNTSCVVKSDGLQVAVGGTLSRSNSGRDIGYIRNLNFSRQISIINMKRNASVAVGDFLALLSHPTVFRNDLQTTFGFVTDDNAQASLGSMGIDWQDAIMTDMSAGPGSSGGPIFNNDGEFIGVHVGGFGSDSSGLELNFQLIFNSGD